MVRRPPTDAAFPPVLVNAKHGYVAPVSRFPVGTLLTDNAADGGFGAVIRVSLWSERSENIRARVRHGNDMRDPERGSLRRRGVAWTRRGEFFVWGWREGWHTPLVQEVPIGVNDIGLRELVFNEGDDMREVWFAGVLTVDD